MTKNHNSSLPNSLLNLLNLFWGFIFLVLLFDIFTKIKMLPELNQKAFKNKIYFLDLLFLGEDKFIQQLPQTEL